MHQLNVTLPYVHIGAISNILTGGKIIGFSDYGDRTRPISIWMDDSATGADDSAAIALANAHDPVSLSVDKTSIQANGTDVATITVNAPKQGAAAVTITVTVTSPGGSVSSVDVPITLTNGVGSDTITSLDPCTITVTVKNPSNRSTDVITITAR